MKNLYSYNTLLLYGGEVVNIIFIILGFIVSFIAASAALFCGLGLGFSVALRRKGRSGLSFAVQFAGAVGIALTFLLYGVFAGSLITPLN